MDKRLVIGTVIVIAIGAILFLSGPEIQPSNTPAVNEKNSSSGADNNVSTANKATAQAVDRLQNAPHRLLLENIFDKDDPAWAWSKVDLHTVREALPDNMYWEFASPTTDPLLLEQREANEQFWQKEYQKILSGQAADIEIHAYYDYLQQLFEDYVTFTEHVLVHYADALPDRDAGLLKLTQELHRSRLAELPQKRFNAIKRNQSFASKRQEWLADKAAYEAKLEAEAQRLNQ